jgi:uncharacterized membrane protein YheB (UPF0754 family)
MLDKIDQLLKEWYKEYCMVKKDHLAKRATYSENFAEALALEENTKQQKILQQLQERETQRSVAKKRYLRGKGSLGSTTLVTEENLNGSITEHTTKPSIEQAILQSNQSKFKQSHHRLFYKFPLVKDFQFKGTTMAANVVLAG